MSEETKSKNETTSNESAESLEDKQAKCDHETVIADRCTVCKKKMV